VTDDRAVLVRFRLEQAQTALTSAEVLLDHGDQHASVNRSYYAMFYSVLALLLVAGQRTTKHAGAIALFDREFVKDRKLPEQLSNWLHDAFDLRQMADYRELFRISAAQAGRLLDHARKFVSAVDGYVRRQGVEE
jgi:uncharacterized protein (UPF0332 family)